MGVGDVAEVFNRGVHGGEIGIVGIHHQTVAGRLAEFRSAVARTIVTQGMVYLLGRYVKAQTDGDGCQGVLQVVGPNQLCLHLVQCSGGLLPMQSEERRTIHHLTAHIPLARHFGVGATGQIAAQRGKIGVVEVKQDERLFSTRHLTTPADVRIQFGFRAHDPLKRTEAFQVGFADIGDQPTIGVDDVAQHRNLSGMVGARFHHRDVVRRREAQQGERHTDVIVQVALGVQHIVLFGQHRRRQLLGRRLAVGSRDLHDGRTELSAMMVGQLLERGEHIVHPQASRIGSRHLGIVHHGISTTGRQSLSGKLIAVERSPFEGKENAAFGAVSGIGGHHSVAFEDFVEFLKFHK